MRVFFLATLLTLVVAFPTQSQASGSDLQLTLKAPESSAFKLRYEHGIVTYRYVNTSGIISTTQWPLIFRIESTTAVGFVAQRSLDQEREALVVTDPDNCLNLASLLDDLGITTFDPACAGFAEDETYIEVQTERNDTFGEFDNFTTGNNAIRDRLIDDRFSDPAPRNTAYLTMFNGSVQAVGPRTGGRPNPFPPDSTNPRPDELDGYGYGADDDLASMVLMADIGGARVFDENFKLTKGVIRNMAGFINTVSAEDLDGRDQTAVTASMHILAGVFEPIAILDANINDPNFDYAIRVDSGKVKKFNTVEPFPPDAPGAANAFYDELLSQYYPARVKIRAVLVHGEAPDFVYDLNYDGKYTAKDVELMGYDLLSNEVETNLTVTHENLLTDSPDSKCPPRTFIHGDLDGNLDRGMLPACILTSGASRTRRPPR
ncbi:MAG: hypothetical protein KJO31_02915 [Gammaproteobacteria bacterium]|nr:hypothetical protein [Gammaproteobacteria bacterium]